MSGDQYPASNAIQPGVALLSRDPQTFAGATTFSKGTASTSTSTGTIIISGSGGLGVGGNGYFGGNVQAAKLGAGGISSTGTITINAGAAANRLIAFQASAVDQAYIGLGSDNNLYIESLISTTNINLFANSATALRIVGATAQVSVLTATASGSTTTGALVVSGGLGIGGALYVGSNIVSSLTSTNLGNITINAGTASTQCGLMFQDGGTDKWTLYKETTNTLNVFDLVNSVGFITFNPGAVSAGTIVCNLTTPSSTYLNGAFQVKGGVGIAGALCTNGALGINGVAPFAQPTGFGTPTGASRVSSFPGASATLAQCSGAIADLIAVMKSYGFAGA